MRIKVYLMRLAGRRFWECQWKDPITGKLKTKSTKTAIKRDAERFAGAHAESLNAGNLRTVLNTKWNYLADRYEAEALPSRAKKTAYKFTGMRRWLKKLIDPEYAITIDSDLISKFQSKLRAEGQSEATIKGHLSALRACLNWADNLKLIPEVPRFVMPKRINRAKGRALTQAEYDLYVTTMETEVGDDHKAGFRRLIEGLWLSGLRIDEAIRLTWEPTFDGISVDLSGDVARLRIEANEDKSSTAAQLLPITPDFADFLLAVPPHLRHGRVFRPTIDGMKSEFMRSDTCSDILCRIGRKSKIVVAEYRPKPGAKEPRRKYASAHDFRRTFGTRWAPLVTPQQLQQLMRHSSIETTMTFYVKTETKEVERATQDAMHQLTNTLPNTIPIRRPA